MRHGYDPESLITLNEHDEASLDGGYKIEAQMRNGFVRKVYGIVACQVLLTTLISGYFTLNERARIWCLAGSGRFLFGFLSFAAFGLIMGLACVPAARTKYPLNMGLLFALTLCMSATVANACAYVAVAVNSVVVLEALVLTFVAVVGLTIFAMQTKYDLTFINGFLTIGLCVLIGIGLVRMIWPSLPGGDLLMSGGGAIIFSGYILVDTQLLMGNGDAKLSPDDYIGAALNIYLDIINLFMSILQLLASSQDNSS